MNKIFNSDKLSAVALSRRSFLIGTGALAVGVSFGGLSAAGFAQEAAATAFEPNVFVEIGADGMVRILYQRAEMGQGVLTSVPLLIAEEMDADWSKVVIERAPGVGEQFGNQNTVGSTSISRNYTAMRLAGAQTRRVLMLNAAEMLGVPLDELATEPGFVVHAASGKRLGYGEIAATGTIPDPLPELTEADLKSPADFRLIGTSVDRYDVPAKSTGKAQYGIDVSLPDMLYGAMARPPVAGDGPASVDDAEALKVPGVVAVVSMPHGVGVVGESLYAARAGAAALKVTWTDTAFARGFNSDDELEKGLAVLADEAKKGVLQGETPVDIADAFANAARTERLTFQTNHVAHATMEPMNATVRANADATFEVWAGIQTPNNAVAAVRAAAGREDAEVAVNVMLLGGGFGRRIEADYVREAAYLAMAPAVANRPVKLVWSREEDLQYDAYRPLTIQQIDAALDADNNLVGWRHRIMSQAYGAGDPTSGETRTEFDKFDNIAAGGGSQPYTATQQVEYFFLPTGIKVGAWRAIGPAYMKYPIETMIDHIADIRGEDPVAYRLSMMPADSAGAKLIRATADMAGWDSFVAEEGRALGFGYSDALGSHTACVADVSVDKATGAVKVNKIWAAIDCGTAVQPHHVEAMMESSIIFSLSPTLREYVRFINGVPQLTNFYDYEPMRQQDIPEMEIKVLPSGNAPTGVGEAGVAPLVPAVTNAVRRALGGTHIGYLPLLPEKVLAAIQA